MGYFIIDRAPAPGGIEGRNDKPPTQLQKYDESRTGTIHGNKDSAGGGLIGA